MTFKNTLKKLLIDQLLLAPIDLVFVLAWTHYGNKKEYSFLEKLQKDFPKMLMTNYMV